MANLDYKVRLVHLDAETLKLRRLNIDLITVYEILFCLTDTGFNEYFVFKHDRATRGSTDCYYCIVESSGRFDARCN